MNKLVNIFKSIFSSPGRQSKSVISAAVAQANEEIKRLNEALIKRENELKNNLAFVTRITQELKQSEERFLLAVDGSMDGIWDWDIASENVFFSDRWLQIIGLPAGTKVSIRQWRERVHPDDREALTARVQKVFNTNAVYFESEHRLLHENGTYIWTAHRAKCAKDDKSKAYRLIGTMSDINDRVINEQKIKKSEADLLEAQQIANFGSYETDVVHNTSVWTRQAAIIFGFDEDKDFNDVDFDVAIHPEDREMVNEKWQTAVDESSIFDVEYRIIKPNGEEACVRGVGKPVFDNDHKLLKLVGTLQDITGEKKLREELIKSKEKAEEATLAKSLFLSTMSHEIRTPLNAVIGFTQLLLLEEPRADQVESLKTLEYSAEHLLSLINDILDYSKIESGRLEFEHVEFNLDDLLESLGKMFSLKAEEKNIELNFNRVDLSHYLIGDTVRLNQILTNLISNALKFTSIGHVIVSTFVLQAADNQTTLRFDVEDTGIGIAEDKLITIFDSFTQASTDTFRKYGGTGLGLAISRKLVEMQGGSISVLSEFNKGSVFSFELTFKQGSCINNNRFASVGSADEDISLRGIRILLVEDNKINVMVASKFLNRWGVTLHLAENGQEAVDKVQNNAYDVVLMDLQMPVMDGYTATLKIRSLGEAYKNLPIIALTASALIDVKQDVLARGMNDFITKPFNPKELQESIKKHIMLNGNGATGAFVPFSAPSGHDGAL